MIQVLYLSYDGMTDPLGQSQVLPYLQGLSKLGYKISLISFEKPQRYEQNKSIIQRICDEGNIDWYPQTYTKRPPILSTVWDLRQMKKTAFSLHGKKQFQIVHARSYVAALIGRTLKKRLGVKFLFDIRGFWVDERVEGNIWNIKNPLFYFVYKFFKWKEVQLFSSADTTISLTEAAKEEIHSWDLPNQPIPIEVIPCCVDTELFSSEAIEPKHLEEKRKNLGIQNGQLVISYLGSIGTWYLLAEMMDFFSKLLKTYPKALFLFITKSDPVAISEMAALKGIDPTNLSIVEASRKEVPYYLALTQLNVFFYKPTFSRKATSPTKQGEVMSLGIPIICNDKVGDTGSIIRETQSGIVLDSFEDSSYQQVIDSMGTLLEIPSERIRKGALTYFSLDMGIQKYHTAYQSLLA